MKLEIKSPISTIKSEYPKKKRRKKNGNKMCRLDLDMIYLYHRKIERTPRTPETVCRGVCFYHKCERVPRNG